MCDSATLQVYFPPRPISFLTLSPTLLSCARGRKSELQSRRLAIGHKTLGGANRAHNGGLRNAHVCDCRAIAAPGGPSPDFNKAPNLGQQWPRAAFSIRGNR
jgi:hypothetical protein